MADWTPPEASKSPDSGGEWSPAEWTPPELREKAKPTPEPTPSSRPQAGVGAQVLRAAGPTLRGAGPYAAGAMAGAAMGAPAGGVGAIPGAIMGAGAVGLTDLALSAYNPIASVTGLPKAPTLHELTGRVLSHFGVPESHTPFERVVEGAAGGAAGGLGSAAAFTKLAASKAPGTAQKVFSELARRPGSQAVSGAAAGTAGQAAVEMGAGPMGQFGASMLGGMLPGAAATAARKPLTGLTSEASAQARVADARAVGVKPDIAYAAPSTVNRMLTKALGGTETTQAYRADLNKSLEREANRIADKIGTAANPNMAGQIIEKALGPDGFLKRAGAVESKLWDKWWNTATKTGTGEMPVNNTISLLKGSQSNVAGAENLSALMKDKQLNAMLTSIMKDMEGTPPTATQSPILGANGQPMRAGMQGGTPPKTMMPYAAMKQLRTLVGEKLDPSNMSPDVSRTALKGLYSALSEDMAGYAKSLGKGAEKEFNRANGFTRGKHDRIDMYLQEVQGKKPYQVWRYASSPESVKDGGHQFLTLNRSMSTAEREVFHATFIKQMGRGANGEFDPRQFVEKYSSLSPVVRGTLLPGQQGVAAGKLVKVIKDMDKSGTLGAGVDQSPQFGAYMLMGALLHAHPKALLTVGLASSKSEHLAKLLSDPAVIDHVSGVNNLPRSQVAAALNAYAESQNLEQKKKRVLQ